MSFKEFVDKLFGADVDLCDFDEDSYAELEQLYNELKQRRN